MSGAITLQGKTQETDFKEEGRVYVNNATRQPEVGHLPDLIPNDQIGNESTNLLTNYIIRVYNQVGETEVHVCSRSSSRGWIEER